MSKEILTIREAVWLTDNTYKYEDLVRMMGEIVSVLGGRLRVSSIKKKKSNQVGAGFLNLPKVTTACSSSSEPHAAGLRRGSTAAAPAGEENRSPF